MDLDTLANLSQIVGNVTIVGGAIFALMQLREFRSQRRDAIAAEVMRGFMSPELSNAITLIRALPDDTSAEQLRARGPEVERAAVLVTMTFETMGLLVHGRIAPFPLVLELAGGIIVVSRRKLGAWLHQMRIEASQPSWGEWFQWLAQQCERQKPLSAPAYERNSDWKP